MKVYLVHVFVYIYDIPISLLYIAFITIQRCGNFFLLTYDVYTNIGPDKQFHLKTDIPIGLCYMICVEAYTVKKAKL